MVRVKLVKIRCRLSFPLGEITLFSANTMFLSMKVLRWTFRDLFARLVFDTLLVLMKRSRCMDAEEDLSAYVEKIDFRSEPKTVYFEMVKHLAKWERIRIPRLEELWRYLVCTLRLEIEIMVWKNEIEKIYGKFGRQNLALRWGFEGWNGKFLGLYVSGRNSDTVMRGKCAARKTTVSVWTLVFLAAF